MLTLDQQNRIIAAIAGKAPKIICPICHTDKWELSDQITFFVLQDNFTELKTAGPGYPAVIMICRNCGNTHFLNVFVLGIAEILGIKPFSLAPQEKPDAVATPPEAKQA